jgi:RNA polymerase sigma factor (sigma-70 family)
MDAVRIEPIRSAARSDAELLRSFGGSACAFREFYDRHVRDVRRFLRAQVGDDLADDLTAETFVVVLRRAHEYRATATTARAWLLGIAANLARRNRRTDTRRTRLASRLAPPRVGAEDRSFDRIDMGEDRAPLRDALSRLATGEREVLLLIALGELSYEEVAAVLGVRVGTVRSRLHRARLQMRVALEEGSR